MENEFSKFSTEELKQRIKPIAFITWFLSAILLLLFGFTLYQTLQAGEMTPLIATPIALSPIAIINFVRISQLKKEIRRRGGQ